MKLVLFLSAGLGAFASTGRILEIASYCDEWNKCPEGRQCWNKQCVSLDCVDNSNCNTGFECSEGKCYSLVQAPNEGRYCDQWTACSSSEQCVRNKCVPLFCERDANCVVDFSCYQGKCVSNYQTGGSSGYCDQWTPCQSKDQCVDKQCVPFTCDITPHCAPNYVCYDGHCIQINPNHTRGRYCDAQNECDILHKCEDFQCKWRT